MDKHVVRYSSGRGSFQTAYRVVKECGVENVELEFDDVLMEHEDNYRFLIASAAFLQGLPRSATLHLEARCAKLPPIWKPRQRKAALGRLSRQAMRLIPMLRWRTAGRSPWQLFFDEKFLANSKKDLCSRVLKREFADGLRAARARAGELSPDSSFVYVGIGWDEAHRFERAKPMFEPWRLRAPAVENPEAFTNDKALDVLRAAGIEVPAMYAWGVGHANCYGGCVKAGQGAWLRLLINAPRAFAYFARKEEKIRKVVGDYTILRVRRGGVRSRVTLWEFYRMVRGGEPVDTFEFGGCGCAVA